MGTNFGAALYVCYAHKKKNYFNTDFDTAWEMHKLKEKNYEVSSFLNV